MASHEHKLDHGHEGVASALEPEKIPTCNDERDQLQQSPPPPVAAAARAPKKRWRNSPQATAGGTKQRCVCVGLAKLKKSPVKSPMFMTSPLSIYAGICRYYSLLDALHGGDSDVYRGVEDMLPIIYIHFGACSIFKEQFEANLPYADISSPVAVEEAVSRSVRHLCDCRCFLRSYHPIREFAFFWRDITIGDGSGGGIRRITKQNVLTGWSCKLSPPPLESASNSTPSGKETKNTERDLSPVDVIYVSPDGKGFSTKAKAVNSMNKSLNSPQPLESIHQTPPATTDLIQITAKINPLFSPLGLLEELFIAEPWRLLVSTILLNVTTRPQVDGVLHKFLRCWPNAEVTARACWEEISSVISVLGLGTKRAKALVRFSEEFLTVTKESDEFSLSEAQVKGLFFVGEYGWAAYKIFILKQLPSGGVKVCDHALQLYVEYQLGRLSIENQNGIF